MDVDSPNLLKCSVDQNTQREALCLESTLGRRTCRRVTTRPSIEEYLTLWLISIGFKSVSRNWSNTPNSNKSQSLNSASIKRRYRDSIIIASVISSNKNQNDGERLVRNWRSVSLKHKRWSLISQVVGWWDRLKPKRLHYIREHLLRLRLPRHKSIQDTYDYITSVWDQSRLKKISSKSRSKWVWMHSLSICPQKVEPKKDIVASFKTTSKES